MTELVVLGVVAMGCAAFVVVFAICYSRDLVSAWKDWREERRRHPED